MTFRTKERSHDLGNPVELYDFYQGIVHWRYTNADRTINYGGFDWLPIPIRRSEISQSPEIVKNALKVTADRTIAVYERFRIAPPGGVVGLTVYTKHNDDTEVIPEWTGRIISATRKDSEVVFTGEPVYASMKTNGLRRCWQKNCPHLLYGPGCKVVKENYVVLGVVQSIAGLVLQISTANTKPDYYFEGGYAEWSDDLALPIFRGIEGHVGDLITVSYTLSNLVVGQTVKLFPGCDHTMQMCNDKFLNILNYGGTPYIPEKNPYDGSVVY